MRQQGLTALVLAGTRPGGDPLARYAGVSHKALISIDGVAMLQRVLLALAGVPAIARIVVAIDRADLVAALPDCGKPVSVLPAQSGPSASVASALEQEGTPLLVTTADHALLQSSWVEEFLAADEGRDDVLVALAMRDAVQAAVPATQRTWLRFADDHYSGCNLFLLRTPAARGVVALWQQLEVDRKRPMTLLRRLGFGHALRYRFGWLRLDQALRRLGSITGARIRAVILSDGRAAIDVDKVADLELVHRLVSTAGSMK
jgi:GTP:adenosylcobinamide-phosphate guanylyltransferase